MRNPVNLLVSLLSVTLLAPMVIAWGQPEIVLVGATNVLVEAYVQAEEPSKYGTPTLYKSLMENQLAQNSVQIESDVLNSVELVFTLIVIEHQYQMTGSKTDEVSWVARLSVFDSCELARWDSTGRIRLPVVNAEIWHRSKIAFDPHSFEVKSSVKEALSEWITEFVADLREANSRSNFEDLDLYWKSFDSAMTVYKNQKK